MTPIAIAAFLAAGCFYGAIEEWTERSYGFVVLQSICCAIATTMLIVLIRHS